jgi:hypothetical protein
MIGQGTSSKSAQQISLDLPCRYAPCSCSSLFRTLSIVCHVTSIYYGWVRSFDLIRLHFGCCPLCSWSLWVQCVHSRALSPSPSVLRHGSGFCDKPKMRCTVEQNHTLCYKIYLITDHRLFVLEYIASASARAAIFLLVLSHTTCAISTLPSSQVLH